MLNQMTIERLDTLDKDMEQFVDMLVAVVNDGASIGFLPPLDREEARSYWHGVIAPDVILLAARSGEQIAGTVQVQLCSKPNGNHRAEIAKLMVHPDYRRHGIARQLMLEAELVARQAERSLLVLDTRDGDPSNLLYQSLGFLQAGQIPYFARSENGSLDATNLYYKVLE
ncbi:GNAT family N-acetyltransferase [Paenibacillus bovis]|uniref:GCN5 family acetyltransferase n=1 Tax=Paenibacillus bovis TaxID=1616788 RepID=A0A172ZAR4_9BACL|nr:GNAT family N-acetyltransferase [Paenibacillus bovis]ANF94724.1 GCN5 family acetyltransferase [Paenibacillus bovis]